MMEWIITGLRAHGEDESRCDSATFFLQYLLELKQFRAVFVDSQEAVLLLFDISKTRTVQLQYQALLCLWILSFDLQLAGQLQSRYEVIPLLLGISRAAVKEKIIRVCLAVWANLLSRARRLTIPVMIGCKVLDFIENLASRKLADEELLADITYVREELTKAFQSLNSFDEYASEIKSGNLHWSPPHKSAIFWSDNAARLEENDGELLRVLTRLLTHSQDPTVLAVAANDLGEYISRRPQGRK
jgi:V-type H+-transporting ATPase subunit H